MSTDASRSWRSTPPLVAGVLFAFAIVCAVFIGAGQFLLASGVIILVATASLLFLGAKGIEDRRGWLLIAVWLVTLFAYGVQQSSGLPIGYALEFLTFGLGLAAIRSVWTVGGHDRTLRVLFVMLGLYLAFALLSSVLGRSKLVAALWQLQYNLKWPLMFGVGTLLIWNDRVAGVMRAVIAWSCVIIVPVLVLEIVSPGMHSAIFGPRLDAASNPFFGVGARYRGPFVHAGYLALISALLAAGALIQLWSGRSRVWWLIALTYFALVLAAGQRQELLGLGLAVGLLLCMRWRHQLPLVLIAVGSLTVLGTATLVSLDNIPMRSTLAQWGLLDDISPLSERAIITAKGIAVAQQYFPLGAGLGTYGGAGAQRFDLSLFVDLGFGHYWWFRQGKFLVDTYWPSVAAESGFLGAFLLVVFFAIIWLTLLRRAWNAVGTSLQGVTFLALAAITLLLANTPSSAILTDPRGAFIFWLIIGSAWRATLPEATKRGPSCARRVTTGA